MLQGQDSFPPPLCHTYLSASQCLPLGSVCKEHRAGCPASCSSGAWLPSESRSRVVGVRAGADRPVCRTLCDSIMCPPPTVGGGNEARDSQAVLVNTHPLPKRNLQVTWGGEQKREASWMLGAALPASHTTFSFCGCFQGNRDL